MELDQEKCSLDIILVDPSKRTIEEKTITSDSNHGLFKEIKKLIECPWAEAITFNEERDHVYVDEEGAFRDHIKFWTIKTNFTIEKDMIKMSFEDDGAGLDLDKIKNKCIEKNLLSESDLSNMTNQDLFAYISKPEFSTNESVNLISGRGIGMESLKEEVDNLNGSIEIQSQKDEGTTFIIKVPLKEAS